MTTDRAAAEDLEGVISLAELVQYEPGAVVSRTLLKKEAGTVTAFAFDVGEGLSEHTAPFDALVMIIEGESEISVGGTRHRVSAGHLLRLPARQPHALKAVTPFKMILIMIRAPGTVS
jgi:quercetin dioxygenase-like cupin family protein